MITATTPAPNGDAAMYVIGLSKEDMLKLNKGGYVYSNMRLALKIMVDINPNECRVVLFAAENEDGLIGKVENLMSQALGFDIEAIPLHPDLDAEPEK